MSVKPGPLSAGAQALAPARISAPDCTVVLPVYVLFPLKRSVPAPALVSPAVPPIAAPITRSSAADPLATVTVRAPSPRFRLPRIDPDPTAPLNETFPL